MSGFEVGSATDTGAVREQNEDALGYFQLAESDWNLFVVCDGMGGHRAGERASAMAVELIGQGFIDRVRDLGPSQSLLDSIHEANERIYEAASSNPEWAGMGTTCVALALRGQEGFIAHIGDSRAYLVRGNRITRLTQDHTAVARMVEAGLLTEAEGDAHPNAGVLERCLGPEPVVEAEIQPPISLQPGDRLLLCSDGIYGPIDEPLLAAMMAMYTPQEACDKLIRLSIERGGDDNATLQLIYMTGAALPTGKFEPDRFRIPPQPPGKPASALPKSETEVFKPQRSNQKQRPAKGVSGRSRALVGLGLLLMALAMAWAIKAGLSSKDASEQPRGEDAKAGSYNRTTKGSTTGTGSSKGEMPQRIVPGAPPRGPKEPNGPSQPKAKPKAEEDKQQGETTTSTDKVDSPTRSAPSKAPRVKKTAAAGAPKVDDKDGAQNKEEAAPPKTAAETSKEAGK